MCPLVSAIACSPVIRSACLAYFNILYVITIKRLFQLKCFYDSMLVWLSRVSLKNAGYFSISLEKPVSKVNKSLERNSRALFRKVDFSLSTSVNVKVSLCLSLIRKDEMCHWSFSADRVILLTCVPTKVPIVLPEIFVNQMDYV